MEAPVQLSSTREAILERIGHTILELSEEVTSEPLPERVVALLDHDRPKLNAMCASVEQPDLSGAEIASRPPFLP